MWASCFLEESRLNAKNDTQPNNGDSRAFSARSRNKFGNFGFQHKNSGKRFHRNKDMSKVQIYGSHEYGHFKRDYLKNPKNNKRKETHEALTTEDEEGPKKH